MISPDRPALLGSFSRYRTGAALSLQYWVTYEEQSRPRKPGLPLSRQIAAAIAKGRLPELSRQQVNGFDSVRLRWTSSSGMTSSTYWFAPANGFAMVKEEEVLDLNKLWRVEGKNVYALKEVAPGAWFPMRGDRTEQGPDLGEYWRYNFAAGNVVGNDPQFDPSIFTAKIPVGYNVSDRRHGDRFYVRMPDGSEKQVHTGDAMPIVKVERPRRPDGKD